MAQPGAMTHARMQKVNRLFFPPPPSIIFFCKGFPQWRKVSERSRGRVGACKKLKLKKVQVVSMWRNRSKKGFMVPGVLHQQELLRTVVVERLSKFVPNLKWRIYRHLAKLTCPNSFYFATWKSKRLFFGIQYLRRRLIHFLSTEFVCLVEKASPTHACLLTMLFVRSPFSP